MDLETMKQLFTYDYGELWWLTGCKNIGNKAGTIASSGYVEVKFKGVRYKAHRIILSLVRDKLIDESLEVDHINGVRNDNRIENLRLVTPQHNQWNQTKAKGYSYHKPMGKWRSQIKVNGNKIHLGYFDEENEARKAYLLAKEKHHKIKEFK